MKQAKVIFDLALTTKAVSTIIDGEVTVVSFLIPAAMVFGPKDGGLGASARCELYGFAKPAYAAMVEQIRANVFPELKPNEFPTGAHQIEMAAIAKEIAEAQETPVSVTAKQYNFLYCFTNAILAAWLESPEGSEYRESSFEDQITAFELTKQAASLSAQAAPTTDAPATSPAEPASETPTTETSNLPATPTPSNPVIGQFLDIVRGNLISIQETSGDIAQIEALLSKIREKQNQQLATTVKMVALLAENSTSIPAEQAVPATV